MAKKRKLRLFPIFAVIVVIVLLVWVINIVLNLSEDNTPTELPFENTPVTDSSESVDVKEEIPGDNLPDVVPQIPSYNEDKTEFLKDAPKPVYTHEELYEMYGSAVLVEGEKRGNDYLDKMIFIGDSTTHGMIYYGVLEGGKETTQVWTPPSGTLAMWGLLTEVIDYPDDDSEMLIADAISIKNPEIVVLTLGVNGVSSLSENQFVDYYQELLDVIREKSPETKIILQSIFPVCDYYEYVNSISMEKINRANSWIAKLASDNEAYYLNTITALVGENGHLKEEYCNGDGIHISPEGFAVILDYIKSHPIQE